MEELKIKNLSVSFNANVVLDNLNLDAKEGEFVVIVGKSGCGKTTLLNAIAGYVNYFGKIMRPDNLGIVFQNYAVFPWLTVSENILFGLNGIDQNLLQHYLKKTGLADKKDSYPYELSGGQRQRVSLARTLAVNPELILMDEPYGALDIYTREKMQKWLLDIWAEEKKTILFVTHSIDEAIILGDRVLVLDDGVIQKEFKVDFDRPRSEEIRFNEKFVKLKKEISQALS